MGLVHKDLWLRSDACKVAKKAAIREFERATWLEILEEWEDRDEPITIEYFRGSEIKDGKVYRLEYEIKTGT